MDLLFVGLKVRSHCLAHECNDAKSEFRDNASQSSEIMLRLLDPQQSQQA